MENPVSVVVQVGDNDGEAEPSGYIINLAGPSRYVVDICLAMVQGPLLEFISLLDAELAREETGYVKDIETMFHVMLELSITQSNIQVIHVLFKRGALSVFHAHQQHFMSLLISRGLTNTLACVLSYCPTLQVKEVMVRFPDSVQRHVLWMAYRYKKWNMAKFLLSKGARWFHPGEESREDSLLEFVYARLFQKSGKSLVELTGVEFQFFMGCPMWIRDSYHHELVGYGVVSILAHDKRHPQRTHLPLELWREVLSFIKPIL